MRLYLLRHGEALSAAEDPEKGLSEIGKKQVIKVAKCMKALDLQIDQIYHSTKKRAQMTAELFATVFGKLPLAAQEGLGPDDDPYPWISRLQQEESSILLVSHLPFLIMLAEALLKKKLSFSFYESSLLALDYVDEWHVNLYLSNQPSC